MTHFMGSRASRRLIDLFAVVFEIDQVSGHGAVAVSRILFWFFRKLRNVL